MDDEYFRLMLSVREDIYPHRVVQETLPKIIRSLSKPKASEFARGFVRRVRFCEAAPFPSPPSAGSSRRRNTTDGEK